MNITQLIPTSPFTGEVAFSDERRYRYVREPDGGFRFFFDEAKGCMKSGFKAPKRNKILQQALDNMGGFDPEDLLKASGLPESQLDDDATDEDEEEYPFDDEDDSQASADKESQESSSSAAPSRATPPSADASESSADASDALDWEGFEDEPEAPAKQKPRPKPHAADKADSLLVFLGLVEDKPVVEASPVILVRRLAKARTRAHATALLSQIADPAALQRVVAEAVVHKSKVRARGKEKPASAKR